MTYLYVFYVLLIELHLTINPFSPKFLVSVFLLRMVYQKQKNYLLNHFSIRKLSKKKMINPSSAKVISKSPKWYNSLSQFLPNNVIMGPITLYNHHHIPALITTFHQNCILSFLMSLWAHVCGCQMPEYHYLNYKMHTLISIFHLNICRVVNELLWKLLRVIYHYW